MNHVVDNFNFSASATRIIAKKQIMHFQIFQNKNQIIQTQNQEVVKATYVIASYSKKWV